MPWSGWCAVTDVATDTGRLRQITAAMLAAATGWNTAAVQARIERAQRTLTKWLTGCYGYTAIATWTMSCPPAMVDICADLAAAYILVDWHGEAQKVKGTPGARLYESVLFAVRDLLIGKDTLTDSTGAAVPTVCDRVASTMSEKEPIFTMGEQVQDDTLSGSLDNY